MTTSLEEKLRKIIQLAYDNAQAVKTIFDQAGLTPDDVQSLADLDKVPVTSKDRLVELQQENPPFGDFLAVPFDKLQHVFFSPGPLYEPHAGESAVMDTIREMFDVAGFESEDVVINTFGYHLIPTGLAVDQVLTEMGATIIPAGVGNADLQIKMMLDLKATGYIGTPSWLMALIQKAEEMSLDFVKAFSLKKALVSAEPLPPQMRQAFVDTYGLSVANAYGTAELGFLAYNIEGGMAMHLLESSIVQVVNPDTGESVGAGESGEVVVTTFNETYPLIRLGTGDLAMNVDPAPGKSRQDERSIILVGRVGDAVKVRGMFVHPNQLRFAIGQVPGVKGFQAIVTCPKNRDDFALHVVLVDESVDKQALTETMSQAIQSACRVKVDQVEFVSAEEIGEDTDIILDKRTWD
jgi:phenylacetate-CoA ligase